MANINVLSELQKAIDEYRAVDNDKLLRRDIGVESLDRELSPLLRDIEKRITFGVTYAEKVPNNAVQRFGQLIKSLAALFKTQSDRKTPEYIQGKTEVLNDVRTHIDGLDEIWAPFVTAAVESRGFLEDEGIRQQYQSLLENITEQSQSTIAEIQKQSTLALENARKLADEIETKARRTATKISVQAAQTQFKEAQVPFAIQLAVWGLLSLISLSLIAYLLYYFVANPPEADGWLLAYYSTIRAATLGAAGSVAAYCLHILRAQLHMFQQNLHRRRVANSIEAFVESALTPEQRDLILGKLVDAVAAFGTSGLVRENDAATPRVSIDNLSRIIATGKSE